MSQIIFDEQPSLCIEKETCKLLMPDMHYHNTYELYYILEGGREYFIEDKFFTTHKGDFIYIPCGMLHRTDGQLTTRILTYVGDQFISRYFTKEMCTVLFPDEPFVFRPDEPVAEMFKEMFIELFSELGNSKENNVGKDAARIAGLIFKIMFFATSEGNTYVEQPFPDKRISSIVQYINKNFAQISSIEEIANRFFLSKYYLCHMFKASLGVPLVTYLHTIRIKAACEMIESGKYKITEIATKCGFNTTPYFCKVFKDEKGRTPSEYKQSIKKDYNTRATFLQ